MDRNAILGRILKDADISAPAPWQAMERAGEFDGRLLEVCALLAYLKRSLVDDRGDWFDGTLRSIERRHKPRTTDAAFLKLQESGVDKEALSTVVKSLQFQLLWDLVAALHDGAGCEPILEMPETWFGLCVGTYDENLNRGRATLLPQHIHPILEDFIFDRSFT